MPENGDGPLITTNNHHHVLSLPVRGFGAAPGCKGARQSVVQVSDIKVFVKDALKCSKERCFVYQIVEQQADV